MAECASLFVKDRLTKGTMLWDASLTQLKTHSVGSEEVDFRSVNWSNWQSNCRLCVLCECAAPLWRADSVLLHPNCLPTEKSNHSVKKMNLVTLGRGERQRNKILLDGLVDFGQNTIFSWTKPWEQSGHLKTCQLKMEEHPHQLLSVRYGTGPDSDQTESQAQGPLTLDSAGPAGSPDCLLQHPDVIKALCKS